MINLENVDSIPRQQRDAEIQKGLLSLLSTMNHKTKRTNHYQEGRVSSQPQPPNHDELKSFIPLLPSHKIFSKELPSREKSPSEQDTFAARYVFSTTGLPPLTQQTKHGLVKITQRGYVELQLPSISRNTFSISPDSKEITVSQSRGVVWRGDVDELPWRWTRVYRYASRFVRICCARIPRVSVEVDGVRGRVMLNGEFEACDTKEGTVIRVSPGQRTVKVSSIDEDEESLQWHGDMNNIPGIWKELLRSSLHLYKKCLAVSSDEITDATAVFAPAQHKERGCNFYLRMEFEWKLICKIKKFCIVTLAEKRRNGD